MFDVTLSTLLVFNDVAEISTRNSILLLSSNDAIVIKLLQLPGVVPCYSYFANDSRLTVILAQLSLKRFSGDEIRTSDPIAKKIPELLRSSPDRLETWKIYGILFLSTNRDRPRAHRHRINYTGFVPGRHSQTRDVSLGVIEKSCVRGRGSSSRQKLGTGDESVSVTAGRGAQ